MKPVHIPLVTVCLCTYKRPGLLASTLSSLGRLRTDGLFRFSVTVVDNDYATSSSQVVARFAASSDFNVTYASEPERNIAKARNCAVRHAQGDYIAFLDDDEEPDTAWLLNLLRTASDCRADGVLGPVLPSFAATPPAWVLKGRFFNRERFPTGALLSDPKYTRTGNVLIRKAVFDGDGRPFDPRFGLTGGEDVDFFRRQLEVGRRFVWSDEAIVRETIPASRCCLAYLARRALLRGVANSKSASLISATAAKSVTAALIYAMLLPLSALRGKASLAVCVVKLLSHLGLVGGLLGILSDEQRSLV